MKSKRHVKILELIRKNEIETQEELAECLERDIRELKLTKVSMANGRQKYAALSGNSQDMMQKYTRIFKDAFLSMDMAQNILVIKTVSGMAMAGAAALDALDCREIVGSIAGDDTIMCAVRTVEDTVLLMNRLRKIMEEV